MVSVYYSQPYRNTYRKIDVCVINKFGSIGFYRPLMPIKVKEKTIIFIFLIVCSNQRPSLRLHPNVCMNNSETCEDDGRIVRWNWIQVSWRLLVRISLTLENNITVPRTICFILFYYLKYSWFKFHIRYVDVEI